MKLPLSIARKLVELKNGEKIGQSKLKHTSVELMLDNGVLQKQTQGRSKALIYLAEPQKLDVFLQNHFGIGNLNDYIIGLEQDELSRSQSVQIASNSKLKSVRTFKGFLANCYQPINAELNGKPFLLNPQDGSFTFIYDFEQFKLPKDIIVVGIENPENFRQIAKQKNHFKNIKPLFVSRYPQSTDLVKWLQSIPNNYLHFGDFDFAGLNIYINEFKKHISQKTEFFLPNEIESLFQNHGNRALYHQQSLHFSAKDFPEKNVQRLIALIEKLKKGLEQEVLIERG